MDLRKLVSFRFRPTFLLELADLVELLSQRQDTAWSWARRITKTAAIEQAVRAMLKTLMRPTSDNVAPVKKKRKPPAERIDVAAAGKKKRPARKIA